MSDYGLRLAARHLVRGPAAPRAAMREAMEAGLVEPWRALLVVAFILVVLLSDTQTENFAGKVRAEFVLFPTIGEWLYGALLLGVAVIVTVLAVYVVISATLWLVTRPLPTPPRYVEVRSVLAVGSWVATLPVAAVGFLLPLLGLEAMSDVLGLALWSAVIGLCLAQVTGLDPRAAMGLSFGTLLLTIFLAAALIFGLVVPLLGPHDAPSPTSTP